MALCWGLGAVGFFGWATPGDPFAAEALWAWAQSQTGDLRDPAYIDAARAAARIRPWQDGYGRCRSRLTAIDLSRRVPYSE